MTSAQSDAMSDLASRIDEALSETSFYEAEERLRAVLPLMQLPTAGSIGQRDVDVPATDRAAAWAFAYRVVIQDKNGRPRVVFEPHTSGTGIQSFPPAVEDVAADITEAWSLLANEVSSPFAIARLNHLLFERKYGNPRDHAARAIDSYCDDAASRDWHRAQLHLTIALRLSRAIGDTDRIQKVLTLLIDAAEKSLQSSDPKPGRVLGYLRPVVGEARAPISVDAALSTAYETFDDVWIRDQIIELLLQRCNDTNERQLLVEKRVRRWLDAARTTEGLARSTHLKKALQLATDAGATTLIDEAASRLQEITLADLGLAEISYAVSLTPEQSAAFIAPVTDAESWRDALHQFTFLGPVAGDVRTNQQTVKEQSQEFVFASVGNTEIIGADGMPIFQADTPETKQEMALSQFEGLRLGIFAPMIARALAEIAVTYGIPAEADLAEFLSDSSIIEDSVAQSMARTLIRFWTGDFEGAAVTAAIRIETLARGLVISLGAGIYKLQRTNVPGQYPGLAFLLKHLAERGMDTSWHRQIYNLCANPAGWNSRNDIAHGFVLDASAPMTAMLIQAMMYLASLEPNRSTDAQSDSPDSDEPETDPTLAEGESGSPR